jgi:hypothetical protein
MDRQLRVKPTETVDPKGRWAKMNNPDRLEALKTMHGEGQTVREMAEALGSTTNAIRGLAWREGMRLGGNGMRRVVGPPMVPAEDPDPEAWNVLPEATPVGFMENEGCWWPAGDADVTGKEQKFCGCRRAGGGSYCVTHASMARGK